MTTRRRRRTGARGNFLQWKRAQAGLSLYYDCQETDGEVLTAWNPEVGAIEPSYAYPKSELLDQSGDGTIDKDNWTVGNNANLTNPSTGVLRVQRDGTNNPIARQNGLLTSGTPYLIQQVTNSDGNAQQKLFFGGVTTAFLGAISTDLETVKVISTADTNNFVVQSITSTGTEYTETRNISVREANPLDGRDTGTVLGIQTGTPLGYARQFDAAASFINIYSTTFNTLFDSDKGGIIVWGKSDTWAAGSDYLLRCAVDANNSVYMARSGTNLVLSYEADGTEEAIVVASGSPTGWFMVALTWDTDGAGAVKGYYDGAQSGTTQTIAGTWAGNFASNLCTIGALSTTPANVWDGEITQVSFVFGTVPTAAHIAEEYRRGL